MRCELRQCVADQGSENNSSATRQTQAREADSYGKLPALHLEWQAVRPENGQVEALVRADKPLVVRPVQLLAQVSHSRVPHTCHLWRVRQHSRVHQPAPRTLSHSHCQLVHSRSWSTRDTPRNNHTTATRTSHHITSHHYITRPDYSRRPLVSTHCTVTSPHSVKVVVSAPRPHRVAPCPLA